MWHATLIIATVLIQDPTQSAQSTLGPIHVTAPAVDARLHEIITYSVRINLTPDVGVTFWSFAILRVYADGSQIVSVQEQDFLESLVLSCASVSSLLDFDRGFQPGQRSDHAHLAKHVGRLDAPVKVSVWPTADYAG